jgi:hypothetical protein
MGSSGNRSRPVGVLCSSRPSTALRQRFVFQSSYLSGPPFLFGKSRSWPSAEFGSHVEYAMAQAVSAVLSPCGSCDREVAFQVIVYPHPSEMDQGRRRCEQPHTSDRWTPRRPHRASRNCLRVLGHNCRQWHSGDDGTANDYGTSPRIDIGGFHSQHASTRCGTDKCDATRDDRSASTTAATCDDRSATATASRHVRSTRQPRRSEFLRSRTPGSQPASRHLRLLQLHCELQQRARLHGGVQRRHLQHVRWTPRSVLISPRRGATGLPAVSGNGPDRTPRPLLCPPGPLKSKRRANGRVDRRRWVAPLMG